MIKVRAPQRRRHPINTQAYAREAKERKRKTEDELRRLKPMKYSVSQNLRLLADFYDKDKAVEYARTQGQNVKVRVKHSGEEIFDSEKKD